VVAELIGNPSDVAAAALELKRMEMDHAVDVEAIPGARELLAPGPREAGQSSPPAIAHRQGPYGVGRTTPASVLVTGEDVQNGKPFPDPYVLAAERVQALPNAVRCSRTPQREIASARAAGVKTIIGVGANARRPE